MSTCKRASYSLPGHRPTGPCSMRSRRRAPSCVALRNDWRSYHRGPAVTDEELRRLAVVVDLVTAATALGIGRTTAYGMVRTGRWPTPVLRLGHRIRVPTAALRDLLGLSTVGENVDRGVAGTR